VNAVDQVELVIIDALCAELKLDRDRARYIVDRAFSTKLVEGANMFGFEGKGLFARQQNDNTPQVLGQHFKWICMPMLTHERLKANRGVDFYHQCAAAGLTISGFDGLPAPENWQTGLVDAINFCASVGGRAFVLDAEGEWKGHPDEAARYVGAAREACDRVGIKLGFTGFGSAYGHPTFPWRIFCGGTDFSIPQLYDSGGEHESDPSYMARGVEAYHQYGASQLMLGVGFYRTTSPGHYRWRTALELRRHLSTLPANTTSIIGWPLGNAIPVSLLGELDHWHPPAESTVRDALSNLVPFGRFFRS
jgi:hypothetical protein